MKTPTIERVEVDHPIEWRACRYCGKTRVAENMLTAGDGQRIYCSERHLEIGEREFRGRSRRR